jgi:hypothetical protein
MFTCQVRKQLAQSIEIVSEREKILARLASGFVLLLAKPKFYMHSTSWRRVIRTPASAPLLPFDKSSLFNVCEKVLWYSKIRLSAVENVS